MKYIALLRGINVGGKNKVEMKKLKLFFEVLGCINVSTYINSGNVVFELKNNQKNILEKIATYLKKEFGFEIPVIIKTEKEIKKIVDAIPKEWQNDLVYKTDVAYLFSEIDYKKIINELPIKKEFLDILYVKGAICWHVERKKYNKSYLNKIINHKFYQFMTIRNINTARHLAEI